MIEYKNLLLLFLTLSLTGCWTDQDGQKTGMIVKVAKEGSFWKTYEGELIRGGFDSGTGSNGRAFHFTLGQFRNALVKKAFDMMEKNKPVIIYYHCEKFRAPWRGATNCFLDKIIEANNE